MSDPKSTKTGWQTPCGRPGCGHTLRDHDTVTTGGCILRDCECRGYQDPNSLGAQIHRVLRRS